MPGTTRESTGTEYTLSLAGGLAGTLRAGDVVRLEGELGAGKTTFVRGVATALGVAPGLVSSPTFVMVNEYPVAREVRGVRRVVHVDAYRLRSQEDLEGLGWDRFMADGRASEDAVVLIEWPGRIEGALGAGAVRVGMLDVGEGLRQIGIEWPEEMHGRPGVAEMLERGPVRCPVSGVWVEPTRATYPFAGEREKMADLNRWFTGRYKVSREAGEEDFRDEQSG